jgi:histidinol dehydrogenase
VIQIRDLRDEPDLSAVPLPRAELGLDQAADVVRPLIDDVRDRGLVAIEELTDRLDGVRPPTLRVPKQVIDDAIRAMDRDVRAAFEEAIRRVRLVHHSQRPAEHVTTVAPGATVRERWIPVRRVGTYAPGGNAMYPSSVMMNVVPAQEAGVESIAIASPPQKANSGWPDSNVLAVASLLGVDEVYSVGGAQAVAMFAFGVQDDQGKSVCTRADMVTGPGNVWVATAKRLLKGTIGTDTEAGPSEVMILADQHADPDWIAADLISQAEHDTLAAAVLVTDSDALAEAVAQRIAARVPQTRHSERIASALRGSQSAILLVASLDDGLELVDNYGPEHLEIQTINSAELARRVRNAGVIFVGSYAPVALGDYCAGSNHVLPTGGAARHAAGLSVHSFLRSVHVVDYGRDALSEVTKYVSDLAEAEDLPAHGQAVRARFESTPSD